MITQIDKDFKEFILSKKTSIFNVMTIIEKKRNRQILLQRYLNNNSYKDIALIFNISSERVRFIYFRCMRKIRKELEKV